MIWNALILCGLVAHDPVAVLPQTPSPVRSFLERGLGDAQAYTLLREL
jgi:hypothetical protein